MITEITEETTVKEICEVLEFMSETEGENVKIQFFSDLSGKFLFHDGKRDFNTSFIPDLPDYIAKHTKKTELNKFMSLSDDEFSKYVYKILEDPKKSEILFEAIKEVLK